MKIITTIISNIYVAVYEIVSKIIGGGKENENSSSIGAYIPKALQKFTGSDIID